MELKKVHMYLEFNEKRFGDKSSSKIKIIGGRNRLELDNFIETY